MHPVVCKCKISRKLSFSFLVFVGALTFAYGDFAMDCLDAHNYYRQKHRVQPLQLDSDIQEIAQAYANELRDKDLFQHSKRPGYGENLYSFSSSAVTEPNAEKAVKAWYDEIKYYDFDRPGFSMKTGHFTQLIWKKSNALGCAVAAKDNKKFWIVANYLPPGNVLGSFPENVPRSANGDSLKHRPFNPLYLFYFFLLMLFVFLD